MKDRVASFCGERATTVGDTVLVELAAANGSTAGRLEQVCLLAAELPGSVSLQLSGDEDVVRALARYGNAQIYGMVSYEEDAEPRAWWSVAVQLDRVRLTAAICRKATAAEIQAVTRWEATELGKTGVLRKLVERDTSLDDGLVERERSS